MGGLSKRDLEAFLFLEEAPGIGNTASFSASLPPVLEVYFVLIYVLVKSLESLESLRILTFKKISDRF